MAPAKGVLTKPGWIEFTRIRSGVMGWPLLSRVSLRCDRHAEVPYKLEHICVTHWLVLFI